MNTARQHLPDPLPSEDVARRITVPLGEDLDRLLSEAARNDGSSEAAYVRQALIEKITRARADDLEQRIARIEKHLGLNDERPPAPKD